MAFAEWKPEYSVGVTELDWQHKKLFALVNEFYESVKERKTKEGIEKIIDGLVQYADYHFSHEESLMRKYRYAGSAAQEVAHKAFTAKVLDFQKRHAEGKLVLTIEVGNFLKDWLTEHILQSDRKYVPTFAAAGLI
jgi:hemerythrin